MQRWQKILLSGFVFATFMGKAQENTILLDDVQILEDSIAKAPTYSAPNQTVDVVHIDLEIKPNWQNHTLLGHADVFCRPYFYATDTLVLDAKGFTLNRVAQVLGGEKTDLNYKYNGLQLRVGLVGAATRDELIHLYIDYVAKPDSLVQKGGAAITAAKGFYFVDGTENHMPQFFTQGEPESNSAWMPTVDHPSEKITHRIGITVDSTWQTLSNGQLEFRTQNGDGTRTDYWLMNKPHAPYLAMMAGGQFDTVATQWQGKPVRYFVESQWKDAAKRIFGQTPEMMSFYSDILKTPYPWPKYDQIVVRDFVSGAMENTTATAHGEFLYTSPRAYADKTYEDYIAHELFHQWFGDLVTCKNWGQLPLNESFATYGEVLWHEYKYSADDAAWLRYQKFLGYLGEYSRGHIEKMIRHEVPNPLTMFDAHSYAKGSLILHMLRQTVGDTAFFESLKYYLNENAYKTTEISDLRKAFEHTTGQNLSWFFDQWFHAAGHPMLDVRWQFDKTTFKATVTIRQKQDATQFPVYRLPATIAVYTRKEVLYFPVEINAQKQIFTFDLPREPRLIKFDADNYLLAEINQIQNDAAWLAQLGNCTQAIDRYHAAERLLQTSNPNLLSTVAGIAMDDTFWATRLLGLQSAPLWDATGQNKLKSTVWKLLADPNNRVRAEALNVWSGIFEEKDESLYRKNLNYISNVVNEAALLALARTNASAALQVANDSLLGNPSDWHEAAYRTIAQYGLADELKQTDLFFRENTAFQSLVWLQWLGENLARGGEEGHIMVDLLAAHATASNTFLAYYAYRFLVENHKAMDEMPEPTSPEAGKKQRDILQYAQQKIDEIKNAR